MELSKLYSAMGESRAEHAAIINSQADYRKRYADLHNVTFQELNLNKYQLINADGKVVEAANEAKSLLTNANGTVRHEDFMVIQDKIVEVRRRKLNGITDLMEAGLSFGVAITEQLVGFENVNEFQEARQDMNPNSYQNNDTVFTEAYVPNPITHQSFSVPWRQDGFSYKRSLGLSESVRQVSERLEDTLFNGNTEIAVSFNGANQALYGYTTHPDRGTATVSNWALSTPAGLAAIVPEVVTQVGLMFSAQGGVGTDSVILYVANDIWTNLQNDYKVESTDTSGNGSSVLDRIKKIAQIKDVKPAEKLISGSSVMVEMEERTIQLAVASDIISVPHIKTMPMSPQVLTTYAAMVQQIKVDSNSNTGIRHLTK
jgi:hypothetical protein